MLGFGIPLCTSLTHAPHLNALHLYALYLNAIFVVYCSALYVHKRARLGGLGAPEGGNGERRVVQKNISFRIDVFM